MHAYRLWMVAMCALVGTPISQYGVVWAIYVQCMIVDLRRA